MKKDGKQRECNGGAIPGHCQGCGSLPTVVVVLLVSGNESGPTGNCGLFSGNPGGTGGSVKNNILILAATKSNSAALTGSQLLGFLPTGNFADSSCIKVILPVDKVIECRANDRSLSGNFIRGWDNKIKDGWSRNAKDYKYKKIELKAQKRGDLKLIKNDKAQGVTRPFLLSNGHQHQQMPLFFSAGKIL